jgi:hypothetical protein
MYVGCLRIYSLGQEIARRVKRQHNEEINNFYSSDIVRMQGFYHAEMRNAYRIFIESS